MKTKRHINKNKSKTKKIQRKSPSLKFLHKGYPLYASKKFKGDEMLAYQKKAEKDAKDSCLLDNSSWFGDYDVAKSYKTKETNLYKWNTQKITKLLNMNMKNAAYLKKLFLNTKSTLVPTVSLSKEQIQQINYDHPYITMTPNQKAYYEFCFAFGYIKPKEQSEFMKLIKYLVAEKHITMTTRDGHCVTPKMDIKITYYQVNNVFVKKKQLNRLSFYQLDKHAMMNLCKCAPKEISGVYQKNANSFWFPDFIVYKMNIQEYILFNSHRQLIFDKEME